MPIYEFQCYECKKIKEVIQKEDDPAPICHGDMQRLVSNTSFILKGTGWYVTDYKDKKKPKPSSNTKPSTGKEI